MRYLIVCVSIVLFACDSSQINSSQENFSSFTIVPAENALLGFDRILEFETDSAKLKSTKSLFKKFGVLDKNFFPGFKISKDLSEKLRNYIADKKDDLLLTRSQEFISFSLDKSTELYYLIDGKKRFNLSQEVKEVSKTGNKELSIKFSKTGVQLLKSFVMNNINKTLLIETNGKLINAAKAIGNFSNGTLTLPIHN